jgi:hypothetical protein
MSCKLIKPTGFDNFDDTVQSTVEASRATSITERCSRSAVLWFPSFINPYIRICVR